MISFYPTTTPSNWVCPNADIVTEKLQELIKLGFRLTDEVIRSSITLFEPRLEIIGYSMLNSFYRIRGEHASIVVASTLLELKNKRDRMFQFI